MHILTKVGNQDNVVTYEHICDTLQDRDDIERRYITLGSTCLVLSGENDTIEVYMADSNKEWHDIAVVGGSGSGSGGLQLYICTQAEVQDGKPAVEIPMEDVLYLVPGGTEGNLYTEYMYVNNNWELFGGATVDLTNYGLSQLADVEINNPGECQILMYLPIFNENNEVIAAKWINTTPLSIVYGNVDNYENPVLYVEFTGGMESFTIPDLILDVLLKMPSSPYIWYENDDSFNAIKQIESENMRIICNNGDIFEVNQETDAFELVSSQGNTSQDVKLAYIYSDEYQTNLLALVENSNGNTVSIDVNDIQDYLENGNGKMFITYSNSMVCAIRELQYFRGFPRITLVNGDIFQVDEYNNIFILQKPILVYIQSEQYGNILELVNDENDEVLSLRADDVIQYLNSNQNRMAIKYLQEMQVNTIKTLQYSQDVEYPTIIMANEDEFYITTINHDYTYVLDTGSV